MRDNSEELRIRKISLKFLKLEERLSNADTNSVLNHPQHDRKRLELLKVETKYSPWLSLAVVPSSFFLLWILLSKEALATVWNKVSQPLIAKKDSQDN